MQDQQVLDSNKVVALLEFGLTNVLLRYLCIVNGTNMIDSLSNPDQ